MPKKEIEVSELVAAIEERIDELGLADNKSEAARRIGIKRQRLDNWLKGSNPTLDAETQEILARFLGVSPRRIVTLAGLSLSSRALGGYLASAA